MISRGKPNNSGKKKMIQCHFLHHESRLKSPGSLKCISERLANLAMARLHNYLAFRYCLNITKHKAEHSVPLCRTVRLLLTTCVNNSRLHNHLTMYVVQYPYCLSVVTTIQQYFKFLTTDKLRN